MRFKISHLMVVTAVFAVACIFYTRYGTESLEFNLIEYEQLGDKFSVIYRYEDCAHDLSLGSRTTPFHNYEFAPNEIEVVDSLKGAAHRTVKIQYRKTPLWPMPAQTPNEAVFQFLGVRKSADSTS